jgi:hypothetical protein
VIRHETAISQGLASNAFPVRWHFEVILRGLRRHSDPVNDGAQLASALIPKGGRKLPRLLDQFAQVTDLALDWSFPQSDLDQVVPRLGQPDQHVF